MYFSTGIGNDAFEGSSTISASISRPKFSNQASTPEVYSDASIDRPTWTLNGEVEIKTLPPFIKNWSIVFSCKSFTLFGAKTSSISVSSEIFPSFKSLWITFRLSDKICFNRLKLCKLFGGVTNVIVLKYPGTNLFKLASIEDFKASFSNESLNWTRCFLPAPSTTTLNQNVVPSTGFSICGRRSSSSSSIFFMLSFSSGSTTLSSNLL